VSLGPRYLIGVAGVGLAAGATALTISPPVRGDVLWGMAVGAVLQVPLGWWALQSLGTDRFMVIWGLGTLLRFTAVGVAGLVVLPALGQRAGPMLGSMVGVMVALLLVEGVTAHWEHSREADR